MTGKYIIVKRDESKPAGQRNQYYRGGQFNGQNPWTHIKKQAFRWIDGDSAVEAAVNVGGTVIRVER